jgi:hypothetical protein
MSLLNRLFKTKIVKAPSLEEQIRALNEHTAEQLLTLVNGDGNEQVREAAIGKLPYGAELLQLALGSQSARLQLSARKRVGQLLDEKTLTLPQLAADVPKQLDIVTLASYSQQANLDVLESVSDPALLLQLACEGSTTQLRQVAAARIETRAELEQLCKAAQSKDKTVYKLAKAKLDTFKAGDTQAAEAREQITQLCAKLEKLAHLEADPLFKAKIALFESEWSMLAEHASTELSARYQQALGACQQQINARAEQIALAEEKIALDEQATAMVQQAIGEAQGLVAEIYQLSEMSTDIASGYRQQLSDLTQAVRLASNRDLPLTKALPEFERAHQHADYLLTQFTEKGTFVQLTVAIAGADNEAGAAIKTTLRQLLDSAREYSREQLPETAQAATQALHNWTAQQAETNREAKEAQREIAELARKGLWAAQQGMVRKARGVHKELQEKLAKSSAAPGELPTGLQSKLDDLDEAIARLSDWHEFAVTPKKEALITQMQTLASSSLNPNDLASKIHELQDEWKSLSRGIQQADENLWEQFQQASQIAFVPCKEYFDAQTQARDANLSKRQELITQLQTYLAAYDWENATWSDVEKTLKVARQEWQGYWPVPRKAAEDLQTTFDGLMDNIHQKLKDYYQSNKAAKQQLIEQAQSCVTAENLAQAIDQIKNLQARWKNIGKSYAKEDQHLWHEFRKHCDAVFARRTQEVAELNQEREARITQAEALIAEARALLALPFTELTAAREDIAKLKDTFNGLDLPREKAKALANQFNQTLSEIDSKINAERNSAEIRSWQDLFALSDSLRQCELARLAQSDAAVALSEALVQQLENPPRLPTGGLPVLKQRLEQLAAITAEQQTQNTHQLRLLCIRAEILTDRETPEADRALRMNYLMQQLQQGLGKRDETMEPLVFEWVALGAIDDTVYAPLLQRFMECLSTEQ